MSSLASFCPPENLGSRSSKPRAATPAPPFFLGHVVTGFPSPDRHCSHCGIVPSRRRLSEPPPPRFRNQPDSAEPSTVGELLATGSVDEMLHAAHTVLTAAERRIGDYCSTFVRGSSAGGAGRRCWHIYRSLREGRRRMEAEAGAELVTTGREGPACEEVEALGRLVRELEFVPVEDMVRVLTTNDKLLRRDKRDGTAWVDRAACARDTAGGGGTTEGSEWEQQLSSGPEEEEAAMAAEEERLADRVGGLSVVEGLDRSRAEAVFMALDRSARGWLDRDDLQAGLQLMGEHLDPSDVEQICVELGSTGRVDFETFCDIVEAERLVVPGSDAIFLRRLHHDRPEWWTEPRTFLDSI